jgi:hypothetical protein
MPQIHRFFACGTLLLTFGAIGRGHVLAQAPVALSSVAGTTPFVSASGATTFGFAPPDSTGRRLEFDVQSILAQGSRVPRVVRALVESVWLASPTFRRQCARLVEARVQVTVAFDYPQTASANAATEIRRRAGVEAVIHLRSGDSRLAEYLAHEIEHILEQIDEVDLPLAVAERVHGANVNGANTFETRRAIAVGRLVAREVEDNRDRS